MTNKDKIKISIVREYDAAACCSHNLKVKGDTVVAAAVIAKKKYCENASKFPHPDQYLLIIYIAYVYTYELFV